MSGLPQGSVWQPVRVPDPLSTQTLSQGNGCILADFMGLGKTLQSIALMTAFMNVSRVIYICIYIRVGCSDLVIALDKMLGLARTCS